MLLEYHKIKYFPYVPVLKIIIVTSLGFIKPIVITAFRDMRFYLWKRFDKCLIRKSIPLFVFIPYYSMVTQESYWPGNIFWVC